MLVHPQFDPVALQLGPLAIHWYGLMYVCGFLSVYLLWMYRIRHYKHVSVQGWTDDYASDLLFYGALGAVLGGRLGYVLFYKPAEYLANPIDILYINQGGMSFHGGLLGVIVALALFSRKTKFSFFQIAEFVAPVSAIGLFFGRMGNFINQELWGVPTDAPWGMVFPAVDSVARHPSMLYEALLEGLLLFIVLWWVARKPRAVGVLSGIFLIGYSSARMFVEFFRVPDQHLDYLLFDWVSMGHLLSLPMLLLGVYLIVTAKGRSEA